MEEQGPWGSEDIVGTGDTGNGIRGPREAQTLPVSLPLPWLCPHHVPMCPPGPCTPQHGSLGTEVLLPCPGGAAEWRRGGTVLGTSPAPGLALPNASLAHEGHYSCHHPVTGETWATLCLRLGCECPPSPAVTPQPARGPQGCWQWGDPCPLPQTRLHHRPSSAGPAATPRL